MDWKQYFAELGIREGITALFAWLHSTDPKTQSKWDAPLMALRDALNARYPQAGTPTVPGMPS